MKEIIRKDGETFISVTYLKGIIIRFKVKDNATINRVLDAVAEFLETIKKI